MKEILQVQNILIEDHHHTPYLICWNKTNIFSRVLFIITIRHERTNIFSNKDKQMSFEVE